MPLSVPPVRPWFGTWFDRRSKNAKELKPLVRYLRRCNFMVPLGYVALLCERVLRCPLSARPFRLPAGSLSSANHSSYRLAAYGHSAGTASSGLCWWAILLAVALGIVLGATLGVAALRAKRRPAAAPPHQTATPGETAVGQALAQDIARRLLRDTDLSVGDIATKTGFATTKYFSAAFKDAFGMSPNEFRAQ